MSYDYKKNDKHWQKRKICTKNYARKRCPPSQLNVQLITKNKKSPFAFFAGDNICKSNDSHYCETVKRKQKPTKNGHIYKNYKNVLYENWLFQEDHLRKIKPL